MKFIRKFGSGVNTKSADPRDKIWAEFKCDLCNESTDIDITNVIQTFQFHVERRCPNCKQINVEDRKQNLQHQIDKLTQDKSKIEIEIQTLIDELNEEVQKGILNEFKSN